MRQDPAVREEAHSVLTGLFRHVGRTADQPAGGGIPGVGEDLAEFLTMPADLARIFADMAVDLTDLVLTALAEAGIVLVKGLTPA